MGGEGRVIVVSGPSGVGKSTIVQQVLRRTGAGFGVSATTRRPRAHETNGRDYRFTDRRSFEQMVARDELLEWAEVFGELYGTPARLVRDTLKTGRPVILDIDVQGAMQVHQKMPNAVFVLIEAPSDEALAERLGRRGSETDASFAQRLAEAKKETAAALSSGVYNYRVVNDDLEAAIEQVVQIVNKER
ncbi:MAG: guanylate kinase [Phycisphaerae bacterium]|nr:guanylate kinase [Phycisphaerae bacterium]